MAENLGAANYTDCHLGDLAFLKENMNKIKIHAGSGMNLQLPLCSSMPSFSVMHLTSQKDPWPRLCAGKENLYFAYRSMLQ